MRAPKNARAKRTKASPALASIGLDLDAEIQLYLERKRLARILMTLAGGAAAYKRFLNDRNHSIQSAGKIVEPHVLRANLNLARFRRRLARFLKTARLKPTMKHARAGMLYGWKLMDALERLERSQLHRLRRHKASPEKGILFLQTATNIKETSQDRGYFRDDISAETLTFLGDKSSQKAARQIDQLLHQHEYGIVDRLSALRLAEEYAGSIARNMAKELIDELREKLREISFEEFNSTHYLTPGSFSVGFSLWVVTRIPSVMARLRPEFRLAAQIIAHAQTPQGCWVRKVRIPRAMSEGPRLDERGRPVRPVFDEKVIPDTAATAMLAVALQRLGKDQDDPTLQKSVSWLISSQGPDGSWCYHDERGSRTPDILATIASLEALRRHSSDTERQLHNGENWLISHQDPVGSWSDPFADWDRGPFSFHWKWDRADDWPDEWLTATILEYFRDRTLIGSIPSGPLTVARGFLYRAEEVVNEHDSHAARLAIISAFHGVELFMYGVCSHPKFDFDYFRPKSGDTYGLREILGLFREELHKKGLMPANGDYKWIGQMKELASVRDQVVHKGHDVSSSNARRLVDAALKFVDHYGKHLLGLRILY